ncbi:MAG: PHP domain-containing protein [Clostridiales bacterium]|nr:PHP domain-containing protein [Clostridiales bacterium]
MILTADYHTHTPYSHGKNTVLENAVAAKKLGLKQIAITDHGFNHLLFGLKRKRLGDLRLEIKEAEKLTGIKVLMGMESNLISLDGETDMRSEDLENFDIYLFGIHEVLKYKKFGDFYNIMVRNYAAYKLGKKPPEKVIENTTKAYINAVKNNPVDILTHINYKCCCDLKEVAKVCADYGTYIELNTKKRHVSPEEVDLMASTGVRFVVDSDAHSADRVGDTKIADELIKNCKFPLEQIDNIDGRLPIFRFAEYKKAHM